MGCVYNTVSVYKVLDKLLETPGPGLIESRNSRTNVQLPVPGRPVRDGRVREAGFQEGRGGCLKPQVSMIQDTGEKKSQRRSKQCCALWQWLAAVLPF